MADVAACILFLVFAVRCIRDLSVKNHLITLAIELSAVLRLVHNRVADATWSYTTLYLVGIITFIIGLATLIFFTSYPKVEEKKRSCDTSFRAKNQRDNLDHGSTKTSDFIPTLPRGCDTQATFYPCQTTHSRYFPIRHSFLYNYLLVGVPINDAPTLQDSRLFNVVDPGATSSAWSLFSIHPKDYLSRGDAKLKDKLSLFLQKHVRDSFA